MPAIPQIKDGYKPRKWVDSKNRSVDKKLLSFPRTFGTTFAYPEEFNFDAGLTNPNQNEADSRFDNPPYPNGCTAFTTTDIATDDDKLVYNPGFTYEKTKLIEGTSGDVPCTIEDSLKSASVYGLEANASTEALNHRRAFPFDIHPHDGLSWTESLWSAMWQKQGSLSSGTPWFIEFTLAPNGVIDTIPEDYATRHFSWHDWKVCGRKIIDGKPYVKCKPWLGPNWGDKGFYYFSEKAINDLFAIRGAACMTNVKATSADALPIKLTVLQTLLSYYLRLVTLFAKKNTL